MLLLGLAVGVIASGFGVVLSHLLGLGTELWQWLEAVPLAVITAGVSAILPAITASYGTTVAIMAGEARTRRSRAFRSLVVFGMRDMVGAWRHEAALGSLAVGIGSSLVGAVVLVEVAFRGQLDATLLGRYLSAQVQPFHVGLAGLALAMGALAAAEIVTLGYLERQPGLAALRALGWPRRAIAKYLIGQAAAFGLAGGLGGGLVVGLGGILVAAQPAAILTAAGCALAAALVAISLALIGPLWLASRLSPARALRGESRGGAPAYLGPLPAVGRGASADSPVGPPPTAGGARSYPGTSRVSPLKAVDVCGARLAAARPLTDSAVVLSQPSDYTSDGRAASKFHDVRDILCPRELCGSPGSSRLSTANVRPSAVRSGNRGSQNASARGRG